MVDSGACVQAAAQLAGTEWVLMREREPGNASMSSGIKEAVVISKTAVGRCASDRGVG